LTAASWFAVSQKLTCAHDSPLVFNILLLFGSKYVRPFWEMKFPEGTSMMRALINLGELGNKKGFAEAPAHDEFEE
jgi:hypothetical protein